MKGFSIAFILIMTLGIVVFLRADDGSDLRLIAPFISGQKVSLYDFAGAIVVLISAWSIGRRLWKASVNNNGSSSTPDSGHWRFRWSIVAVIVLVMVIVWLHEAVNPSFQWSDILNGLGIRNRARYTQLAVLVVLSTAAVLIVRVATAGCDDEN